MSLNFQKLIILFLFFNSLVYAKELKKVTLQLSWFDQFQFAGYYVAKEQGFYKDYGLDVEIKPFNFGINVPEEVDAKRADFGVDRETLILQRVQGKKLVALYALFQDSPLILISKDDGKINSVEDFVGKKVMTTIDDSSEVSIKAMLLSKNTKMHEIDFIKHSHNVNDLIESKTDLMSAYLSKAPYELQKMNVPYKVFNPKDYGFDMYSDFLFTNQDMIDYDLSTALAFKHASLKGWQYAYSHIDETVDLLYTKYNEQNLTKEELKFEAEVLKRLSFSKTDELGLIVPEKIQRIYDLYNVMGLTPNKIDLDEFVLYDNFNEKLELTKTERHYIKNNRHVNTCILPELKPYSFVEENSFHGFVSDYLSLIEKKSGLKFDLIQTQSFDESLEFVKSGQCDILASAQNVKERRMFMNFTEPFLTTSLVLITKNEKNFIDDISILKDKKISIYKSYSFNKILREKYPDIDFVDVEDLEDGISKVEDGEIFGHIDFLYTAWNKIHSLDNVDLKISGKLDENVPLAIAINKNRIYLNRILEKSVKSISDEEKDRLLKKWVAIEYKKEFDYKTFYQVIFVFVIVLIIFIYRQILLKNMNKKLKNVVDEKTRELKKINQDLEKTIQEEVDKNLKKDALLTKQSKMAAIGEMLQNIAHQWRQPLSVISTGASGLKLQKEMHGKIEDKFLDETLTSIVETSVHLSTTIDDFMHFFKPNEEQRVFNIKDTVNKTLNIFDYNLHSGKIRVEKDIEDVKLINYESELIQVIMNILSNSKDAFVERQIEDRIIFITTRVEGESLEITIKDTAGGIPSSIVDKIFNPYFTTKHQYQGTGIGLFMCQEIITKHMDGEITVSNREFIHDDKEFVGAEFILKFKLK
ncbi:histidine kinase [Arcobacter sp. F155]|uniref:ABC transporter substrate-binding protein n=1 Tax=Arcobacter sp. F155 TaxID=2044512 RepID=UPI00100C00D1|nr:ABC transporter substrate-binding protein [Arcobacter sp. F155]RXJ75609.1 histidine kinase [Arcobacter sp. F155]